MYRLNYLIDGFLCTTLRAKTKAILDFEAMNEMTQSIPHLDVSMSIKVGEGLRAVAGMEELKRSLRRDFIDVIAHRGLAKKFSITPPNMLFYGPPGTGKTYVSMRLAEECGLDVCTIRPSDLGSIWLHGSQSLIKELFKNAEEKARRNGKGCLLLVDEFDAICGKRDVLGKENQADEVAEWLTQLNDCVEKNVFVVGTTNCIERIDKAVIRHGRIDQVVFIGMPDLECRKQIFEIELDKRPHTIGIDTMELAQMTQGFSSSDVAYVVKETAIRAFEASISSWNGRIVRISEGMLKETIREARPSLTPDEVKQYEKTRDEFLQQCREERRKIGFRA